MFILIRALTYATLFVGFLLVFLPAQLLRWSGVTRPSGIGVSQIAGAGLVLLGAALAISCIVTFVVAGRGTPAPFDPPRRLVTRGPYRFVRNPMYLGAVIVLGGAGVYYGSAPLIGYALAFLVATHLFVRGYEEPALRAAFGEEYETYCRRVKRWWPRRAVE
jgi:protein-S-isoprenylcysteine O-methyltransferase Ste14